MNKIQSGIEGLDALFENGIPQGSNILIFGKPGSGKTVMALEFLYRGASEYNEAGVFVSFEQSKESLLDQCAGFGWDVKKYLKNGKLVILTPNIDDMDREFANNIINIVKNSKAKRLVIDNLALLVQSQLYSNDSRRFSLAYNGKIKAASNPKQLIYNLINILKNVDTTTIYITSPGNELNTTCDGISEYICDGIIHLDIRSLGKSFLRTIEASKMRRSDILGGIHGFKITKTGIKVE